MLKPFVASFAGTAVEFFETAVIAYAIARAGYPREAISAVIIGHVLVFGLAVYLFPLFVSLPLLWLRLVAAVLLLAMGLHWVLKSARRLSKHMRPRWAEDPLGKMQVTPASTPATAFSPFVFVVMGKSSLIEATEILVVVFPIAAATASWVEPVLGAAAAIAAVSVAVLLLHGKLQQIPEVKIKLAVGLVLTALGIVWLIDLHSMR